MFLFLGWGDLVYLQWTVRAHLVVCLLYFKGLCVFSNNLIWVNLMDPVNRDDVQVIFHLKSKSKNKSIVIVRMYENLILVIVMWKNVSIILSHDTFIYSS